MKRSSRRRSPRFIIVTVLAIIAVAVLLRYVPLRPSAVPSSGLVRVMPSASGSTAATTTTEINPDLPSQAGAVVSELDGPATVVRGSETFPAMVGMVVNSGDRLEVGATSTLVVTWPHYGRSRFAGGTVVDVNEAFESTDRERFLVRLQLETGRIWSRFETVFGPAAYFEVRASNTVAVAIGTSFGMKLTPKTVAVDVMESHVQVLRVHDRPATQREIAAGSGDMVAEKVGIEVILGPKQKMDMAVDAGKLPAPQAMSDAELKDPFIQKGNQRMTAEELNIAPSASAPSAAASTKLFP